MAVPITVSGIALPHLSGGVVCGHSGLRNDASCYGIYTLPSCLIQPAVGRQNIFHQLVMRSRGVEYVIAVHGFLDFAAVHAGIDAEAIAGLLTGFAIPDPGHGVAIGGHAIEDGMVAVDPPVLDGYPVRAGISVVLAKVVSARGPPSTPLLVHCMVIESALPSKA